MQALTDIRFWLTTAICIWLLAILLRTEEVKYRGWLAGFVGVSWALFALLYVLGLMVQKGALSSAGYGKFMTVMAFPATLADLAGWALLLVYVIRVRAGARQAINEARQAEFRRNLDTDAEHDLVDLATNAVVTVSGNGRDITQVVADAKNLIDRQLRVVILPGTCFNSGGAHQNMVAVETMRFTLQPHGSERVQLRAACANAARPIPTDADRFYGVHRVSEALVKFLQHAANASAMTRQAGVWAITDNYTRQDVQARLVSRDQSGNQRPAVSDAEIAEARRILDLIGVRHQL